MLKFNLKQSLIAITLFAVLAYCLAGAARGEIIAWGLLVGMVVFFVVVPVALVLVYQLAAATLLLTWQRQSRQFTEPDDATS